jgi:MFS transporter, PAT family, beta-lactamase induction signal transducer AmpG
VVSKLKNTISALTQRPILVSLLLGFSSGLPLALTSSTLQAWFASSALSLKTVSIISISFVTLVSWPYLFKFMWAPVMDRWVPPFLGRRRGWMLLCQIILIFFISFMAFFSPENNVNTLLMLACVVAFLSASQDIAVDAYRVDLLHTDQRALGAAMSVNGYRTAMLVSGGLALVLAEFLGWRFTYLFMAGMMSIGIFATLIGPEPEKKVVAPRNFNESVVIPFTDFLSRPQALWILGFIVLYKLGDAFAGAMVQTYLIIKIRLSLAEIGVIVKTAGFLGTILGTVWGALWVPRLGLYKALYIFGILQAIANLMYVPLLWTGPNYYMTALAIFSDNICGGMGTAAFVGLLMGLCNPRFTAFQYALLSALGSVGRVIIGPLTGRIVEAFGWETYFVSSLLFAAPSLILLYWFKNDITWHYKQVEGRA